MTTLFRSATLTGLAFCGLGIAPALAAPVGYSLGTNGSVLVSMPDLSMPGNVTGVGISDGVRLSGLAYRPNTRELYGFGQQDNTVYTVNPDNGQVSPVVSTDDGVSVGELGIDFNNQVDAARIVSTNEDNLVFFPAGMESADIQRFTDLFYPEGDVNAGVNPSVFSNAYTNQVPNAETTQQYVLDSELDILATLANNSGVLGTIGQLSVDGETPLDFTATGGFDIFSAVAGENTGYTLLNTASGVGLYELLGFEPNENGFVMANFLGQAGDDFGPLDGLAVYDNDLTPVPLPAGFVLLGSALVGFGALRRRRGA